jgi:hypothetical protein
MHEKQSGLDNNRNISINSGKEYQTIPDESVMVGPDIVMDQFNHPLRLTPGSRWTLTGEIPDIFQRYLSSGYELRVSERSLFGQFGWEIVSLQTTDQIMQIIMENISQKILDIDAYTKIRLGKIYAVSDNSIRGDSLERVRNSIIHPESKIGITNYEGTEVLSIPTTHLISRSIPKDRINLKEIPRGTEREKIEQKFREIIYDDLTREIPENFLTPTLACTGSFFLPKEIALVIVGGEYLDEQTEKIIRFDHTRSDLLMPTNENGYAYRHPIIAEYLHIPAGGIARNLRLLAQVYYYRQS